ncbi:FAD-dependent oxidoreductase [uncultured Propionivibrio sp.]|uniref:FAD-dependent oxidoreductase n=1 Tax=uncultured Propionivibrio sp. TaxID=426737 RepID=UPI0029BFB709|nr:FAD-dependent oxidoreductase [uncultured Propionivibrio sp.]
MTQTTTAIPHAEALARLASGATPTLRESGLSRELLLERYHPDHAPAAAATLQIGANAGERCHPTLAELLQSNALIDGFDLAGAEQLSTDVLVIGGGGAGAAAALTAASNGADVIIACKLRLGDSNTVMAEGGIQAALGRDDGPQRHFEDTLRGGHYRADPLLVAQLASDAPDAIRWLIELGMHFDVTDAATDGGTLRYKQAGGCTQPRILSYRDYTGLEMMRVLRETVELDPAIRLLNRCPAVELLSHDDGSCAGAVLYDLEYQRFVVVSARSVILATGGCGRLHLQGFPTSNHYGATADGLVLAYRLGAKLRDLDSFQYHPTGIAFPSRLAGGLISEAARSGGAWLINGLGERFIDELAPRDVVTAAILRECADGRGIERDGRIGVFLDTPQLARQWPEGIEHHLPALAHLAAKCGIDPATEPMLVYPTLHYQNGGVVIDGEGRSTVPGLLCAGEVSGGIHGRNRLMGNALLDIIAFGRRAGQRAAEDIGKRPLRRGDIEHVYSWQRTLVQSGLPRQARAPRLYPGTSHYPLHRNERSLA